MTFEVRDYYDFVRLLYQHPEWQEELGNLLIAREIRELPQLVHELTEAQKRTDEQLQLLTQRVDALAEAQKRTDEQLQLLTQRVDALAEAQKRTDEQLQLLTQRVDALAEAQKRTDEQLQLLTQRVDALAEAQKRTEQRVEELAEAQKRTDEQLQLLTQRVDALAEAQKRSEERLDQISTKLGRLENLVGVEIENEAAEMLLLVLEEKGYRPLSEPFPLALNGEVDVILRARDLHGKEWTVVLESKVRLGGSDVKRWEERMRSPEFQKRLKQAGYPGPYLVYMYGIRVNEMALKMARDKGIGLIKPSGEQQAATGWEVLS